MGSAEPTARSEATKNMVYSATENVKKRLGSCEKVTMKLRSLLNISNISSTCASHKRLEESSQVKDREFSKLYKLGGELGKGGFGVVYAAVRRADKLQVAVKEVYKAKIIKKTADGKIPLEVALMQQVADVPGVIKILDWFESAESFFIVMEKFAGQDLFDYISERGPLKEAAARDLFAQVLETALSPALKDLIQACLDTDPRTRLSLEQLSSHPWLCKGKKSLSKGSRDLPSIHPTRPSSSSSSTSTSISSLKSVTNSV